MSPVVLLIEDDPGIIKLFRIGLNDLECEIESVTSLAEAFERLKVRKFDLILLDLSLPDSNGEKTLCDIIKRNPEIPIIVITGIDADYQKVLGLGAQDFFTKPAFNFKDLKRSIMNSIERHKILQSFKQNLKEAKDLIEKLKEKTNDH